MWGWWGYVGEEEMGEGWWMVDGMVIYVSGVFVTEI